MILRFTGQDSLKHDLWGNLKFYRNGRYFLLPQAVAYQISGLNNSIIPVNWNANYQADEDAGIVTFQWSNYDPAKPLIFLVGPPPMGGGPLNTPGVCWSTYLGGDGGDRVYASDTDEEGNYYVGGFTYSQVINFPVGLGMVTYQASPITFVSKFGTGYESRWSTFYGGSTGTQWIRGLAVRPGQDPSIVIGGWTEASDLWYWDPQDGSYFDNTAPLGGGFLAELDSDGGGLWSTYFGNGSISVINLDLHESGSIAVCGDTHGPLPPEQDPAPPMAEHWNYAGNGDSWIALLKPERRTYWTTFMGGSGYDYFKSVRFGGEKVVCLGLSESSNFPLRNGGTNAHNEPHAGGFDVTVSEFTLDGECDWSTYLGGSGGDQPGYQGLAIRPSGLGTEDVFVVGITDSGNLPVVPGTGWFNGDFVPLTGYSSFLARFSGTDRSLLWLTYVNGGLSNSGETNLETVAIDRANRLFLGGYTRTDDFPYQDAWQLYSSTTEYGAWDGVLMCFDEDQELRWSTRFGGAESGMQGERIETISTWSDERFFAAGVTYTAFSPQTFFPFTDPVGDNDYFDNVFYPQWDAFLSAFCTQGLLTGTGEREFAYVPSATPVAPGVFEIGGLPTGPLHFFVQDATGRLVQTHTGITSNHWRLDLTAEAEGIFMLRSPGMGVLRLPNLH